MTQNPVTFLFTDLENSTELLGRGADEGVQQTLRAHHRLLKRFVVPHRGLEIRWLGDGLLVVFVSADDALACAVAIQQAAQRRPARDRLPIRIALHAGDVPRDEPDYFGTSVVIARRLCDHARAGQILSSDLVAGLLAEQHASTLCNLGPLVLNGLRAPLSAHEVLYRREEPSALLNEPPFVGREAELGRLTARLRLAKGGSGGLAMLVGEPGIGKTRTLQEFGETARTEGALVLGGRCYEGEASRPYGPFVEALGDYVRATDAELLRADLGFGAAPLARLVPALRERLPDVPEPSPLQPDEERVRLLDAVTQLLVAVSTRMPVVLVLDDLHWADAASIQLIRHAARIAPHNRLLLLGAYRDVEVTPTLPLTAALGALPQETSYEHIPLGGLGREEVGQWLDTVADREVPAVLARAISVETNGNPFFIREVLLNLLEGGQWTPDGTFDGMAIPPNVRQVIARRLGRLSESTNRLLRAAAGFTGSFRLDVAARVADLDEAEALDAIDEALAAQLVSTASGMASFDFVHALVRHTLYAELIPPRRARLHRRIAEAMEQANGPRVSEAAGEIAQHYHRSAALPGAERGVPFAILAADQAERSAAFVESVGYLRTALNLLGDDDAQRPRLVARLALGLAGIPSPDEAVEAATRAGELIAQTEGSDQAADFLADAADALWLSASHACSVATQGLRFIGERRDTTWARLMVHDLQRQEAADPDLPGIPLGSPERLRVGRELWKLPALNTIPQMLAAYLTFRSRDEVLTLAGDQPGALAFWAGDYRRALPLMKDAMSAALERGQIGTAAWNSALIARLHAAAGDLSASMDEYARAVALADRAQNPALLRPQVGVVPVNHVIVTGEGWEFILMAIDNAIREGGAENYWLAAVQHSIVGHCAARLGRSDEALRRLELTLPAIERAPGSASNYPALVGNVVSILETIERTDHIETIERNLRAKWLEPDFRYSATDARLSLALLCGLQGRCHEAAEWFDRARLVLDDEGSRPLRARVDFHEARMHLRRGAAGDSARAARLLDAALAQFRTIGMPGWIRVAEELRAQCESGHPETAAGHPAVDDGASPVADEVVFQNEGQYWTVSFAGAAVRMRDTRGIRYLACLVRAPGREMSCLDIAVVAGGAASDASFDAAALRSARLEQTRDLSGAGPALDSRAKAEYRRRLTELASDLEEAERFNDTGHADRLRREIELLETQLVAAVGLGGRDRTVRSSAERARIAVRKRIKLAITQIAAHHATLARHLSLTVKTGQLCSYRPQPTATGTSLAR